jgi:biopolymer transport protein TolR
VGAKIQDGEDEGLNSEINIIPLVDIMLVLLIIFMVAAPMMNDAIDIRLPKGKAKASDVEEKSVILGIKPDQSLFIGRAAIPLSELNQKLTAIYSTRDKKEIFINADEAVTHGFIVKIMTIAQQAGVSRISFQVDPSK